MLAKPSYLSLALLVVAGTTATAQTLQVLPHCDADSACVEMTLDVVRPAALTVVRPQDADGHTTFELSVHGVLAGGSEAEYRLRVPAYTAGLSCSHFGQAT